MPKYRGGGASGMGPMRLNLGVRRYTNKMNLIINWIGNNFLDLVSIIILVLLVNPLRKESEALQKIVNELLEMESKESQDRLIESTPSKGMSESDPWKKSEIYMDTLFELWNKT